jgi:ribosomal protein S16
MLKIRLARAGKKNMPFFRVVLTEHLAAPKSGYKEVL